MSPAVKIQDETKNYRLFSKRNAGDDRECSSSESLPLNTDDNVNEHDVSNIIYFL